MLNSAHVFMLKPDAIAATIRRHHLCQEGFAQTIGLSRSHWSQVFNRRKPASPRIRRMLLNCPLLQGVPEQDLWEEVPPEPPGPR